MPFLDTPDHNYFRRWEAAEPRSIVVLLHGFGEHSGHYHRLALSLADAGHDVWAIDHTGHGLTGGERGRFGSVAELALAASALQRTATARLGPLPVFLVGHSLGGVTAALMAVGGERVDGLVLTGAPLSGRPAQIPAEIVFSTDESYLDALATDPLAFDTAPAEEALWVALDSVVDALVAGLPSLELPVLLVNGQQDPLAPLAEAQAWAARLRRADVVAIADGHHDIVNDSAHREVAQVIKQFLERQLESIPAGVSIPTATSA
jgi:alpha-beta hydrolase superfamily lysophospholipase